MFLHNYTNYKIYKEKLRISVRYGDRRGMTVMNEGSFDFGKKPVNDGYIKVTGTTIYNESAGFGIDSAAEAGERKVGDKELLRDYLIMGGKTFRVDVENGTYMVRVSTGDYDHEGDVVTAYIINGEKCGAWVNCNKVASREYEIDVKDGQLVFEFLDGKHPVLNAIEFSKKSELKMTDVSAEVLVSPESCSVKLTWDKVDGAYGYTVKRLNKQNRETDIVREVITESFTDDTVLLADSYEYTVTALYGHRFNTESSSTVAVKVVNGEAVTGEVNELAAEVDGETVKLSWTGTEAVYYNVYQKAPYGLYKLLGKTKETSFTGFDIHSSVDFIYAVEGVTLAGVTKREETLVKACVPVKKKKMETLSRGLVAVIADDGVFLSWRLNAYEYELGIDFVLYRNGKRITDIITTSTNYFDKDGKVGDEYTVKAVLNGKAEKEGYSTKVLPTPYIPIPLDKPESVLLPDGIVHEYTANDASVADVDGDGEYEIILRWDCNGKDNSHKGVTGNVYLDAYKLDGTKLWRIDLGKNIRAGSHYTQFMVYDFNNDGCAELICKTADGTVDGVGNVIGDADADYRNNDGFIIDGPEYLTMFAGKDGAIIDTTLYDPARGDVSEWGDSWGNRVDRFLACVAYLDGENPSVIMCRGYYDHGRPTNLVAYDVVDNKLKKRWAFRANKDENIEYTAQGNHNLGVGDVDGDGRDEIVYGAMAVDHDGTGMYSTGIGHGDCINVGNFDPDTPNLDCFQIHEEADAEYGFESRDPATGKIRFGLRTGRDTTRGLCAKIDPRYRGNQCWVMDEGLYTMDGEVILEKGPESINFAIWWDGDLLRELLDHDMNVRETRAIAGHPKIYKWDYENSKLITLLAPEGVFSNNYTKGTPCIQADILGDWREEVVWRSEDNTELRIYTTTHLTDHKFYTLMHDSVYRTSVAFQNTAYNQCTQTGFYIGPEMDTNLPVPENDYVRGKILPEFTEDI